MGVFSGQLGDPNPVAFLAGNFTASGSMTWTVGSGDQTMFEYVSTGGFCRVRCNLVTTTVGGTPSTGLLITIPNSLTSKEVVIVPFYYSDNGTTDCGYASTSVGGTLITLNKPAAANWSASTDATAIFVDISFRVN